MQTYYEVFPTIYILQKENYQNNVSKKQTNRTMTNNKIPNKTRLKTRQTPNENTKNSDIKGSHAD